VIASLARPMTDFLFYGDTERSAAMRHELPIAIGDPFLLAVVDGRMHVMVSTLERSRVASAAPHAELHDIADLGFHELLGSGMSRDEMWLELTSRAARRIGVREAVADPELPIDVADRLRSDGIVLRPDHDAIAERRRIKSPAEMEGIERAQAAAEAGMAAAAELLRRAEPDGEALIVDGEPLTARPSARRCGPPAPNAARRRPPMSSWPPSGRASATSRARGRCRRTSRSRSTSGHATRARGAGPT
jgi:Xaa-Pro aminopeptidase